MPILVQKIIFDIVPQKSPFLIRPIANLIFNNLHKQLLDPEFKKHFTLVASSLLLASSI